MKRTLVLLMIFLAAGCFKAEYKWGKDIYETETDHACVTIKALNSLAAGDTNRATYLMRVEAFMVVPKLAKIEKDENIPEKRKASTRDYLRELMSYLETHMDIIDPGLPMTKHCVDSLDEMLTLPEDRSRLETIKARLKAEMSNRASHATSEPAP